MKRKTITSLIAAIVIVLVMMFSGCIEEKVPYEEQSPQIGKRTEEYSYISFEELYRDTPTNLTDRKAWEQWESKYKGKCVKETGRLDELYILPPEGKFYLIITMPCKECQVEYNGLQVLVSIENVYSVGLGEKEGTLLINDITWIGFGDIITFSGGVSNYSSFDMELVFEGYDGLIVVDKGKIIEVKPYRDSNNTTTNRVVSYLFSHIAKPYAGRDSTSAKEGFL